jgi:hypothetical protein
MIFRQHRFCFFSHAEHIEGFLLNSKKVIVDIVDVFDVVDDMVKVVKIMLIKFLRWTHHL